MEGEFIGCGSIVARLLEFSQIGIAEVLKVHICSSARCAGGNYRNPLIAVAYPTISQRNGASFPSVLRWRLRLLRFRF